MSCSTSVSSGMSPSAHFLRHYTPLTTTSPISLSSSSESSLSSSLSSSSPSRSIAPYLLAKKVPDWHFDHFPQVPCSFEHLGYGIWELHYISLFFGCWKYRWSMQRSHYKGERSYSWVTNYWEGGMMDWRPQDQCQGHHQGGSQYWHLVNWWSPIEIQLFYNAR